ncbi:hypothetical protein [Streptantibioticus ferralitis]|uniref:Phytanoyl-CoA dioxygenase family protein n=1 Tax=Streptantibioticus ferralitis TaxID=236510 RepID=A0ABT5ZAZ2_9ACTN|nr:hypothetical protein [Streptantibioticus ferralitis]MDF2261012.1 hypothetical protein [Streptantibioticus ferralitis]
MAEANESAEEVTRRRARYELFGFEVFPGLLGDFAGDVFREIEEGSPVGNRLSKNTEHRSIVDHPGASPALTRAVSASGLADIAAGLLDSSVLCLFGEASEYRGDISWHGGTLLRSARLVTFVLHDRPLGARDGAVLVLPGSHRSPGSYRIDDFPEAEVPGWAIETGPGDVIALEPRLQRAAIGGRVRRQVAVTFAAEPVGPAAKREIAEFIVADRTAVGSGSLGAPYAVARAALSGNAAVVFRSGGARQASEAAME